MVKRLKSFLVISLAILFGTFFQITKHNPVLRVVNVFGDDPYDTVGSFGVLLAFFASVLSLLWAILSKKEKQFQTKFVIILAVLVTLFSDVLALIRYQALWPGSFGGQVLTVLTFGLILITSFVAWITFRSSKLNLKKKSFKRAGILTVILGIILFMYPAGLRQSIVGEIGTIIVGMSIFFLLVQAGMKSLYPDRKISIRSKLNKLLWVILFGAALGAILFTFEAISEGIGIHLGIPVILISIFVGATGTGAVLCYLLLSEYLGI